MACRNERLGEGWKWAWQKRAREKMPKGAARRTTGASSLIEEPCFCLLLRILCLLRAVKAVDTSRTRSAQKSENEVTPSVSQAPAPSDLL